MRFHLKQFLHLLVVCKLELDILELPLLQFVLLQLSCLSNVFDDLLFHGRLHRPAFAAKHSGLSGFVLLVGDSCDTTAADADIKK